MNIKFSTFSSSTKLFVLYISYPGSFWIIIYRIFEKRDNNSSYRIYIHISTCEGHMQINPWNRSICICMEYLVFLFCTHGTFLQLTRDLLFFFFRFLVWWLVSPSNPNPTTNRLINQKGVPFLSPCCSSSPMFSLSHSHTYILYESPSAYHVITTSKKFWPVRAFWCLKYVQLCHNHDHICKYANFFISTLTFS